MARLFFRWSVVVVILMIVWLLGGRTITNDGGTTIVLKEGQLYFKVPNMEMIANSRSLKSDIDGEKPVSPSTLAGFGPNHNVYNMSDFGDLGPELIPLKELTTVSEDIDYDFLENETYTTPSMEEVMVKAHNNDYVEQVGAVGIKPPDQESWQIVQNGTMYVFSAHRDPRQPAKTIVYVFGIMTSTLLRTRETLKLYCHLVVKQLGIVDTVLGTIKIISLRNYKFESFILECRFDPLSYSSYDSFVSVVRTAWEKPSNAIIIHDNIHDQLVPVEFSLCNVRIMKNNTDYHRFIEWMELNVIIGVQRIVLYVTDCDSTMTGILNYYRRTGYVDVVDMSGLTPGTWLYAELGFMQECVFRTMLKTKYLMLLDVDEIIAPRQPYRHSLSDMIKFSHCENRTYISALNYFFPPDWPDDVLFTNDQLVANKLRLSTLLKTQREPNFLRFENRSRSILRPENVDHVKAHKVWLKHGLKEFPCVMHPDVGALHHFDKMSASQNPRNTKTVQDRSLHRYKDSLIQRTLVAQLGSGL